MNVGYGSPFLVQGNHNNTNVYNQHPHLTGGVGGMLNNNFLMMTSNNNNHHTSGSPGLMIPMVQMPTPASSYPVMASSSPGYPTVMTSAMNNDNNYRNQYPGYSNAMNQGVPDLELLLGNEMSNRNKQYVNNTTTTKPQQQQQQYVAPSVSTTSTNPFNNNNTSNYSPTATTNSNNNTASSLLLGTSSTTIKTNNNTPKNNTNTNTTSLLSSIGMGIDSQFPGKGNPNERYSSLEYLKDELKMRESDIIKARNEHIDPEPDMCLEPEQIRDYAGTAIFVYFRFLKFLLIIIAIQFVLSLINYIIFAANQSPDFKTVTTGNATTKHWYSDFFITSYTEKQRVAWSVTTIIGLVVIVLGTICYRQIWIGWFRYEDATKTLSEIEALNTVHIDESIIRYTHDGHISVANHYRSALNFLLRRLASFLIFGGFVCAQVFSSIAITKSSQDSQSIGVSFAIAFIAAILNMSFTLIARKLTELEKYHHMESADRSLVIKLVCFKVANLMAVYGAKSYGNTSCVYDVIGEQFLTLLLVEIFFVTPSTLAIAALTTHYSQTYAKMTGGILGDDNYSARFELPVEYLAALYKFCIAAMAMVVFPLSTILSVVAFFVEFWGARYRLIKICGKPEKSEASHRNTVVFITLLIFIAVIMTPFAGAAFVLSGRSMLETNTTMLCNGFPRVP